MIMRDDRCAMPCRKKNLALEHGEVGSVNEVIGDRGAVEDIEAARTKKD